MAGLKQSAQEQLRGEVIRINGAQAEVLLAQFRETAGVRGWWLHAVAIMANHVHWVVSVPGDPDPEKILGDFKAWGSRALNQRWGKPASETWWTAGGSKRRRKTRQALLESIEYVRTQEYPLVVWLPEVPRLPEH
jgi:REP element-mobilizing transposase RayT